MPTPRTVPDLLTDRVRRDGARPLVTFYDDRSGERVELSVATYANWVAKTAGLVQDELEVPAGGLVLVDLPTHWCGVVWLGAAWSLGLRVATDPDLADGADLVVCGPDALDRLAHHAGRVPVVASSLRPLGGRFTEPLPTGVVDYGAVVLAQPDLFLADEPPQGDTPAWQDAVGTTSQSALLAQAQDSTVVSQGGRLLTDVNPCSVEGLRVLLAVLAQAAGAVWVRHPDADAWDRRAAEEHATDRLRAQPARS